MEARTEATPYSGSTVFFARIISFIFHPLLIGVYLMAYLVFVHPSFFIAFDSKAKLLRFLTFVNNNFILPSLVVLLLRGLGFSKSIYLRTQKERIVPYIACTVFFFWTFYVFKNLPGMPEISVDLTFGMFLAACMAVIMNNFFKVSMHAIAAGGGLGMMINIIYQAAAYSAWPIIITLLLSALICSSRKIASDHTWFEIFTGFFTGLALQLISAWI
ncbi:hypothetical protein [Pollutibacter soli]|uniref:hypothetical protein n=1 Tax=Pollutibacter soli TaxID=3034157 RepID=UPI0030132D7E